MESNTPAAFAAIVKRPAVALPLVATTALVASLTHRATSNTSSSSTCSMLLSLPVVAAAALVPATGLYYFIKSKFGMYIQRSIDDDLSMISAVYNNGKGCFLVAVEKQSNNNNTGKDKIVGIIGGHDRQDGVVEIRRMSVSYASQGVGLGRKLIKRLEEECRPAKMFLTCTSMQYAAHRLYSKAGFVLQDTFTPGITASWLLRNSILILLFEKRYIDN